MAGLIEDSCKRSDAAVTLAPASAPTAASVAAPPGDYLRDSSGEITRSRSGECWHDRDVNTPQAAAPECGDVVVAADSDGDRVPDDRDRCPGTPSGAQIDSDGCPLDTDGDGVDAGQLTARGYGETSPVADSATRAGRQQNRRVELIVQ